MKIMQLALLVASLLCVTAAHAMEEVSKEQQLLEGTISILDYLFYIEDHPEIWGDYSAYLLYLRTADYSNYPTGSLYDELIDKFAVTVRLNRLKFERGRLVNNPQYSLDVCRDHIIKTIQVLIASQHALLNSGLMDRIIGKALPEGI